MARPEAPATPLLDRELAAGPPLELGEWSLTPAALELLLELIEGGRERVVECGSGAGTVVLARALERRRSGRLWSLEHDPSWARWVQERLEAEGLAHRARVVEAPLRPHPLAPPGCEWYAGEGLAELPERVDLLVVDGPPGHLCAGGRIRYPALPALRARLAPGATVVLDDAARPGEAWTLARWQAETPIRFERRARNRIAIGCMFPPGHRENDPQT